jgi:hypothetical protein
MNPDGRRLGLFLAKVGGLYVIIVGIVADLAEVLSLKHGVRLLGLLLLAALGYKAWEIVRSLWDHYRVPRTRLEEIRDFVLRSGERSAVILLCAQARWLYQQYGRIIRVKELQSSSVAVLDLSDVPLRPDDNLVGMHFVIVRLGGGERARGSVQLFDSSQACVELYQQMDPPQPGDIALPLEPPEATELERLLGTILFIAIK